MTMPAPVTETRTASEELNPRRRAILAIATLAALGTIGGAWAGSTPRTRFSKGLLWRISRSSTPDSFVFGTMHRADPRVAEPSAKVLQVLSQSRIFVMEVAVDAVVAPRIFDNEELPDDGKLEPLIGAETFGQARRILIERGLSEPVIARMKPWVAMLAVASSGAQDASLTLDSRLL
ncbi:MAG: TraB/GumN family protein, partial [Burkholderiales bacterium]